MLGVGGKRVAKKSKCVALQSTYLSHVDFRHKSYSVMIKWKQFYFRGLKILISYLS